jgi:putative transposase
MKYAFIASKQVAFPTRAMCKALQVSRSGYYDWRARKPSGRA